MYPFTAMNFKSDKRVKLKDLLSLSSNFDASNVLIIGGKEGKLNLKFLRMKKGPTFSFKIEKISLKSELKKLNPKIGHSDQIQLGVPKLILSGFNKDNNEVKLMNSLFSNLFPKDDFHRKNKISKIKRIILIHYEAKTKLVEIRNYQLKRLFTGIGKGIKKIVNSDKIPDMADINDIADLFSKDDPCISDSDVDQIPESKIEIEERGGPSKNKKYNVSLRLHVL